MTVARYLSHPQVQIDPQKEIQLWSLNDTGAARVARLAQSNALAGTRRIVTSAEVKAVETARPLADALGCALEVRERMHENDRSATGFLPPREFEQVADQFFAEPETSVRGWETARAAQSRIVSEVRACLRDHDEGDVLFVGHGGVGTLLYCHLAGLAIDRAHDQGPGGGGCYFAFPTEMGPPAHPWRPMEQLSTSPP
ncbi:histidine phosphatase family protein [uncultured Roseobacter sp.]|uniref:histidine phosphatase family protein n=1 Tax=uncultured Roseobacter sp. TaxID=114847 RepID=UPI0026382B44|nr:histidine phosphatase family protein [uncultured Roseobacter sp.]